MSLDAACNESAKSLDLLEADLERSSLVPEAHATPCIQWQIQAAVERLAQEPVLWQGGWHVLGGGVAEAGAASWPCPADLAR